jgi:hypothetical protein
MSRQVHEVGSEAPQPALTISLEKVCFVVVKAREFDAKDQATEPDPGSNPADDGEAAVLEEHEDDPVVEELTSFIDTLSEDEQIDLVALAWLGRDGNRPDDWTETRREAARAHNERTAGLSARDAVVGRLPGGRAFPTGHVLRRVRDRAPLSDVP